MNSLQMRVLSRKMRATIVAIKWRWEVRCISSISIARYISHHEGNMRTTRAPVKFLKYMAGGACYAIGFSWIAGGIGGGFGFEYVADRALFVIIGLGLMFLGFISPYRVAIELPPDSFDEIRDIGLWRLMIGIGAPVGLMIYFLVIELHIWRESGHRETFGWLWTFDLSVLTALSIIGAACYSAGRYFHVSRRAWADGKNDNTIAKI